MGGTNTGNTSAGTAMTAPTSPMIGNTAPSNNLANLFAMNQPAPQVSTPQLTQPASPLSQLPSAAAPLPPQLAALIMQQSQPRPVIAPVAPAPVAPQPVKKTPYDQSLSATGGNMYR